MTTFMPFIYSCNSLQKHDVALLTEQNHSLPESVDLIYPKKLKDFHQCPIVVAVFDTPPFIIIKSENIDDPYDGLDTQFLEQLAKKFNFKLIYRQPPDKQRGIIFHNGTVTGCIKMVFLYWNLNFIYLFLLFIYWLIR